MNFLTCKNFVWVDQKTKCVTSALLTVNNFMWLGFSSLFHFQSVLHKPTTYLVNITQILMRT